MWGLCGMQFIGGEIADAFDSWVPFVFATIVALIVSTVWNDISPWLETQQVISAATQSLIGGERLPCPDGRERVRSVYRK